jgi:Lar family restriction alleviation protein
MTLKPCPFCGGTDVHCTQDLGRGIRVLCEGCRATASHYVSEEAAASAWNRRAEQPASGMVMVPRELTPKMVVAVHHFFEISERAGDGWLYADLWKAMLSASGEGK